MSNRAILIANSASMIDHFNKDNITILQSLGYDITVAANFQSGNSSTQERIELFRNELVSQNIDVLDLPIPRSVTKIMDLLKSTHTLKKYLRKNPCEIIHTQTPFGGLVGRIAAKRSRKKNNSKVIYFAHGFHFFKGAKVNNYLLYYNVEKHLSKLTDCLITLNSEDYDIAAKDFNAESVRFVPGVGVDCEYINNININNDAKKQELGIPNDSFVILSVAELIPRKNLETTLEVFSKVNNSNCTLLICGKGQLLDALKEKCNELNISDRVIFAGYRTDILEIFKIADMFLFTSKQEGLPVSVMQAMAAGLPVIASNIRGNRDLLIESGDNIDFSCLVNLDDIDSFVTKTNMLIEDSSLRRELSDDNKIICREKFDIRIVHRMMLKIYKNLV